MANKNVQLESLKTLILGYPILFAILFITALLAGGAILTEVVNQVLNPLVWILVLSSAILLSRTKKSSRNKSVLWVSLGVGVVVTLVNQFLCDKSTLFGLIACNLKTLLIFPFLFDIAAAATAAFLELSVLVFILNSRGK